MNVAHIKGENMHHYMTLQGQKLYEGDTFFLSAEQKSLDIKARRRRYLEKFIYFFKNKKYTSSIFIRGNYS